MTITPFDCAECNQSLASKANLLQHGREQQHQPYACVCGTNFLRLDVLNRHLKSFASGMPEFPCTYCRRHQGENGFRRADHLKQHIREYHHHDVEDGGSSESSEARLKYLFPICSHLDCPQYRAPEFQQLPRSVKEATKPFAKQSDYTRHMRDEHNECSFPCDVQGCARVGRKGYFREKDLLKHRKEQHSDAPQYTVTTREADYTCREPGCGKTLALSSVSRHERYHKWCPQAE
jgi:hypothetical protein